MKERPITVPKEAIWNASEKEWELGEKNDKGDYIGEWKWWLAPIGHLCCHSFFDDKGTMLSFKRFHPNGEVSRYGTFKKGKQIEDVYLKSTEATTENFAYGNSDDNVYKAVKRSGFPIEFDYYDKDGNHLNPPIIKKELISRKEATISESEIASVKGKIDATGKRFLLNQFDKDFYNETILPLIEEEHKRIVDSIVKDAIANKEDFVFHDGDLHLSNLHRLSRMGIGALVVKGNLTVDGSISLSDDPMQLLYVTGNVQTNNVTTSGMLYVLGHLTVNNCLMGDYNHGSTFIGGNLTAKFFHPEEYFFEVLGSIDFTYAFGNAWRLNQNQNPEAFNYNGKKLADFITLLHDNIHKAATFKENKSLLDDDCDDGGFFEYIDRYEFMSYIRANKPVFKD